MIARWRWLHISNCGINRSSNNFSLCHADPTGQPTNGNREKVVCVLFHKPCQVGASGWRTSKKNWCSFYCSENWLNNSGHLSLCQWCFWEQLWHIIHCMVFQNWDCWLRRTRSNSLCLLFLERKARADIQNSWIRTFYWIIPTITTTTTSALQLYYPTWTEKIRDVRTFPGQLATMQLACDLY